MTRASTASAALPLRTSLISSAFTRAPKPVSYTHLFLNTRTLFIIVLGLIAFSFGTAAGVLCGKVMYLSLIHIFLAICIRLKMPSCMRAPPLAEKMTSGRRLAAAYSTARVIFSPCLLYTSRCV